ncbi:MAG TPA: class I SAM-dependent methyltransferase [Mucilaginibacter sp.]|jgi:trans-aconitate methyltransferase
MTTREAISLVKSNRIPTRSVARWADLGCGDGLFTHALATFLPAGSTIYGVDKSSALKAQTTSGGVNIIPVKADFISDSLPFDSLDGIIMANALHYVKDKTAFLQKLQAHLKPGALIILVEYDTDTPVPVWVPYPLSFSSLEKLAKTNGYGPVQKLGSHPSVYGNRSMYAAIVSHASI